MEKQLKTFQGKVDALQKEGREIFKDFPGVHENLDLQFGKLRNFIEQRQGVLASGAPEIKIITKLRGEDFDGTAQKTVEPTKAMQQETSKDNEANELKLAVDALEPHFMSLEESVLIDEQPDMVLRGIAKRAGLPITEDSPKVIDVNYIKQIKAAITKKQDLEL